MILPILLIALSALDQAVVDSDYFATATQRERCATVLRIRQDGTGTGVVIAWDAETRAAYAVTAYHVVDGRGEITAESFSSDQSSPIIKQSFRDLQVVAFDAPADLAIIRFPAPHPLPVSPICPADLMPEGTFYGMTIGCSHGDAPSIWAEEEVHASVACIFPWGRAWRTSSEPIPGRSGGPLYDRRGLLLGVCCLRLGGDGFYTDLDLLHKLIRTARVPVQMSSTRTATFFFGDVLVLFSKLIFVTALSVVRRS